MSSRRYWQQLKQAYRAKRVIWLIAALVVSAISWAAVASVDEVVLGPGTLVPSSSVQQVQSLDGGILRTLHVNEGSRVTQGDLLVTLDETRARASFYEAAAQQDALKARLNRRRMELDAITNEAITVAVLDEALREQLGSEAAAYRANLEELRGRINRADQQIVQEQRARSEALRKSQTLRNSLALLREEIRITREAVEAGALSASELRQLERDRVGLAGEFDALEFQLERQNAMILEAEQARDSLIDEFRATAQEDLSETRSELARLSEKLSGLNSQLEQTRLYAGVTGTVKRIRVNSIGGVIRPGETILEIVPGGDRLLVETRIAPKDIAHVHEGDEAIIKLSAYDFVIYGGVRGQVTHVSADALTTEDDESYYLVHVAGDDEDWRSSSWQGKPLIPGMQAQVDILSGKKTVLQYWLKPLLRARAEALREP